MNLTAAEIYQAWDECLGLLGDDGEYKADHASFEAGACWAEAEFAKILPGPNYMDPPDGGDVSVIEQFRRMAEDARKWREQVKP